jgi:hypothetical protein
MSRSFEITMKLEGRNDVVVRGEFTEHEHRTLLQYLDQYDQLGQSKPLREGFPCEMSVKWKQGSELCVEASLPDNDTLGILLHRLRPFILTKEPASYIAVSGIVGRRVENVHLRQLLGRQRMLYDGRQFQQVVRIASNDMIVNSERVLSDWLNSHEYHRDPDKRKAVEALFARIPGELMRCILISMLVDKVQAIRNVASLVAVLLGRSESLTFKAYEPLLAPNTDQSPT